MRIQGRLLRPSSLAERRILKALGSDVLRVPRKLNPFSVARHIRKIAAGTGGNLPELRAMLGAKSVGRPTTVASAPVISPDMPGIPVLPDSTSEPREALAA